MPLVIRGTAHMPLAVIAVCDWCGGALSPLDGLVMWQERDYETGTSEAFAWRRPDGTTVQTYGILLLHTTPCEPRFAKANGGLDARLGLGHLAEFIAMGFEPSVRRTLGLDA